MKLILDAPDNAPKSYEVQLKPWTFISFFLVVFFRLNVAFYEGFQLKYKRLMV